jgi:hypothetical protein
VKKKGGGESLIKIERQRGVSVHRSKIVTYGVRKRKRASEQSRELVEQNSDAKRGKEKQTVWPERKRNRYNKKEGKERERKIERKKGEKDRKRER